MVVVGREGENVNRALVLVNAVPVVKFVEVKKQGVYGSCLQW